MTARPTFYAEDQSETTTTSTTFQDKVTLTIAAADQTASASYLIIACAQVQMSSNTTEDFKCKLRDVTGSVDVNVINVEGNATTDYFSFMGMCKFTAAGTPADQTYKIQFASETSGTTKIKNAAIFAIKMDTADQYWESTGSSTTGSTTIHKIDQSFTPASTGDYCFLWCADVTLNSTSANIQPKLVIAATTYGAHAIRPHDGTSVYTAGGIHPKLNLSNASKTVQLDFNISSAITGGISNARVAALRHDVFTAAQGVFQGTLQNVNNTAYADVTGTSLTFTPNAEKHLVLSAGILGSANVSNAVFCQTLEGASSLNESAHTLAATSELRPYFHMRLETLANSSTTWKHQLKRSAGSSANVTDDEAGIGVFEVGTFSSGPTGTIAATLAGVTASLTGAETFTGTIASTLAGVTPALTGWASATGTLGSTLGGITAALAGWASATGTIASTLGGVTAALSGTEIFTGTIAATLGGVTFAATGWHTEFGTITVTLSGVTMTASGKEIFTGTLSATLGGVTAALAGWESATGTIGSTLAPATASITAAEIFTGTLASTLGGVTCDLEGSVTVSGSAGTLAATLGNVTAAFVGEEDFTGTLTATLAGVTASLTGWESATGSIAAILGSTTALISAQQIFTGTASAALGGVSAALVGWASATGTIAATLGNATMAASGSQVFTGSLAAQLSGLVLSASGWAQVTGALSAQLSGVTVSMIGGETFTGSLAATLGNVTMNASGHEIIGENRLFFITDDVFSYIRL